MENNKKTVLDKLDDLLKPNGFKRNGNTWYFRGKNDVLILINFQKSVYSSSFYLNFGVYFEKLAGIKTKPPAVYDWQFAMIYDTLMLFLNPKIEKDSIPSTIPLNVPEDQIKQNLIIISSNIETYILPFLQKLTDYEFLLNNFPQNFPANIFWTQNYKREDLRQFFINEKIKIKD